LIFMSFLGILASASPLSETSTMEIVLLAMGGLLTIVALLVFVFALRRRGGDR